MNSNHNSSNNNQEKSNNHSMAKQIKKSHAVQQPQVASLLDQDDSSEKHNSIFNSVHSPLEEQIYFPPEEGGCLVKSSLSLAPLFTPEDKSKSRTLQKPFPKTQPITSRSMAELKDQHGIKKIIQGIKKGHNFNHTRECLDGLKMHCIIKDNVMAIYSADADDNVFAFNTIKINKDLDNIKKQIKQGDYNPRVPVKINGQRHTIPFAYHNDDIIRIAKHYKIPLLQQDDQSIAINARNKKYFFYDKNGNKKKHEIVDAVTSPCLINIDGHLSLHYLKNGKSTIFDAGFLFAESTNQNTEDERQQMRKNIAKIVSKEPKDIQYIGLEIDDNTKGIVESQLLDKKNCVTGLMSLLLDGYNPTEDITTHLSDRLDEYKQKYTKGKMLSVSLSNKKSMMDWLLECYPVEPNKEESKSKALVKRQHHETTTLQNTEKQVEPNKRKAKAAIKALERLEDRNNKKNSKPLEEDVQKQFHTLEEEANGTNNSQTLGKLFHNLESTAQNTGHRDFITDNFKSSVQTDNILHTASILCPNIPISTKQHHESLLSNAKLASICQQFLSNNEYSSKTIKYCYRLGSIHPDASLSKG
jgi:hypothetical protein